MLDLSLREARSQLDAPVDRAVSGHGRVTITQDVQAAAVLVSAEELADLEAALALARQDARKAAGQAMRVPQGEARRRLGPLSVTYSVGCTTTSTTRR